MSVALLKSKPHEDITDQYNYDVGELNRLFGAVDVKILKLQQPLTTSELDQVLASKNCFKIFSFRGERYDGRKMEGEHVALPTVSFGSDEFLIWSSRLSDDDYLPHQPERTALIMDISRLGSNKDVSKERVEGKYYVDPSYIEQMRQALHKP